MIKPGLLFIMVMSGMAHASSELKLSFTSAFNEMIRRNTTVSIQKSQLESAEILLRSQEFSFLPSLSISGSKQEGDLLTPSRSVTATASINLFRSGADLAGLNAAQSERDYQKANLDIAVLQTEKECAEAIFKLIEAKQRVDIIKRQVLYTSEFQKIGQLRYKRGLLPIEDVNRLDIDSSNLQASLDDAQAQLNLATSEVESLLGHSMLEAEWPWKTYLISGAVNELLNRIPDVEVRPDFRSAQLLRDREDHLARRLHRSLFPSLDLSYSKGQYETVGDWNSGWSTVLTLTIPIFNGLQDYSQYRVKTEDRRQAEFQLERLRRDEMANQKAFQENLRLALRTANDRERTLKISEKLLNTNLARFRAGRADANELSVERSRKADAETFAAQGWAKAHRSLLDLLHSFGQSAREIK
jgi:outer membrane protein TolC